MNGRLRFTGFIPKVSGCSQSVVPEQETSAASGNLMKMQILRAQIYPISRALGGGVGRGQMSVSAGPAVIPDAFYSLGVTLLGSRESGVVCEQGSAMTAL